MQPISAEKVEATWQNMATIAPGQAQKLVAQMSREQPLILAYLLASGEDLLNYSERELLVYLGVVIWQMMQQGDKRPALVTEARLQEIDRRNLKMLEYLEGDSEEEFFGTVQALMNSYNQHAVLGSVVEVLMVGDEDFDEEFELEEDDDFDDDPEHEHEEDTEEFEKDKDGEEDDDQSDGIVRDEFKGMMMLYLKTVIDCLDQ